jgi:Transposase zinc-ribbon domain
MLSIREFMELFPDEQACRNFLFPIRWPRGFICTKCGESKYSVIRTRNLYECTNCKTQTSSTSGTVMHRTKLPLSYWLFTFYWVGSGQYCSARMLANTLDLNYRTALKLLHSVRYAMFKAEFNGMFAFWQPDKPEAPSILKKAKLRQLQKADSFIRGNYRRVSDRLRYRYHYEYRFRSINSHNPSTAVQKLITSGFTTIYTINEYRSMK